MCFHFHHLKVDYKDGDKWSLQRPDMTKLKSIMKELLFWENKLNMI